VKVPKKLDVRWHDCTNCGCSLDRDHNAAINIKNRAEGHPVLKGAIRSAEILYGEMAGFSRVTQKVEYALSSSTNDNLISIQVKLVS
jgi:Putative transposase DNA-binding domain